MGHTRPVTVVGVSVKLYVTSPRTLDGLIAVMALLKSAEAVPVTDARHVMATQTGPATDMSQIHTLDGDREAGLAGEGTGPHRAKTDNISAFRRKVDLHFKTGRHGLVPKPAAVGVAVRPCA
jgi:hypothetical protein